MIGKNIASIALRTEYKFNNKNNSRTAKKYSCKNIRHTYKWPYIQLKNRSKFLYLVPIKSADIQVL